MTDKLQDWQRRATEQARNLGHVTDGYIRDNTWWQSPPRLLWVVCSALF